MGVRLRLKVPIQLSYFYAIHDNSWGLKEIISQLSQLNLCELLPANCKTNGQFEWPYITSLRHNVNITPETPRIS